MNPIGFSTGALALGDFRKALKSLKAKRYTAVELSALRTWELFELLKESPSLDLSQFTYVAVHAPSSFTQSEEPVIVRSLAQFPHGWTIVLHPDTIHDPMLWLPFGDRLALENMDRRKDDGRSFEELSRWFEHLPEARFCLDLAHAQQWDTTMTETYLMLKAFAGRMCQIHISQLDSASHHFPMSGSSVRAFSELAWLIPDSVPYIIESRIAPQKEGDSNLAVRLDAEVEKVRLVIDSAAAYQTIPA